MVCDTSSANLKKIYEKKGRMYRWLVILSLIYANYASDAPVVGILSQETYLVNKYFPLENHDSYIAASYVKFLESAGARVIPVWVLFPGGGTYFNETGGYGEAAQLIYTLAVEANEGGRYFPLWGTCLGMQVLGFAAVGEDIRVSCSLKNKAIPLDFVRGFESSRLFGNAPKDIINFLKSHDVTFNYHQFCLTEEVLERNYISSDWRILSTNKDEFDFEFVSAMESTIYPIYGVQFHPEKNQFEFGKKQIPHNREAVRISQYFANFFVDECRKSPNSFPSQQMMKEAFVYNYSPRYTGLTNGSYEQIYVFDREDFEKVQLV